MQTTRWSDEERKNLDEAISKICSYKEDEDSETGDKNFKFKKIFVENQRIFLNSREVIFNYIEFSYDSIVSGELPIVDRTTVKEGFIIIYLANNRIYYIINKYSGAESLLRKFSGYKGKKNKIVSSMLDFSSDFFIWLIEKIYNKDNVLENSKNDEIIIKSIKGFKGNTDDFLNKVAADGETIMNIISTLSFLLESKNLNQIRIDLEYATHNNIELTLNSKKISTLSVEVKNYRGSLNSEISGDYLLKTKLILITYVELLPEIFQIYQEEKKQEFWTKEKYNTFINRVGDDLMSRIKEKMKKEID